MNRRKNLKKANEHKMSEIKFGSDEKAQMVKKVQGYFEKELDQDIGRFDAEFLIDFLTKEMGPFFYNKGLQDAQAVVSSKSDEIVDAIYELEKPLSGP